MITTQFGSEVELLRGQDKDGYCKVKRLSDGAVREWHVTELRADNQDDLQRMFKSDEFGTTAR